MRRFMSAALLALFVLQSSGAAMAAPPASASAPSLLGQIHFAFTQMVDSLAGTQIGAFVLGRESQYQAMHAPPPVIPHDDGRAHLTPEQMRASLARNHEHVLALGGVRVAGPPLPLRPVLPKMQSSSISSRYAQRILRPSFGGARRLRTQSVRAQTIQANQTQTSTVSSVGVNRWWTYEEGAIPGVGKYMVNVAYGTLMVQMDDVDVHERGIDLAIRRTYNGQLSVQRDWNSSGTSDDGAPTPGMWGQGWTSNLDTHLALNSSGGISLFDIDGARYDYPMPATNQCVNGPPGVHMTLCDDGGYGYFLWKKNGTVYHYWSPDATRLPSGQDAYAGRLYMVMARNENNWIRLDYSWSGGDSSTSKNLRTITVTHADGHTLTLNFAPNPNNGNATLLVSVQRPWDSGPTIFYTYDANNDLQTVTLPSNGSNNSEYYLGYNGPGQLAWVASPRYSANNLAGTEGGYLNFVYDGTGRVTQIQDEGIANFAPSDGTGALLQPSEPSGLQNINTQYFTYNSGETDLTDSDGHAAKWMYDTSGRVTQASSWTGAPNNLWLTSYETWDGSNNLTESVDARGNPTDYGYDGNGNAIWVQQPQVATSLGTGRPVARYAYDQYNNVTAYCDPQYVWTTGATTCSGGSGTTHYTYNYADSAEPYGYLTDAYQPTGYHRALAYSSGQEGGGDFGLPTGVTGDSYVQADGTTRTPAQTFSYDSHGNLVAYNKGNGAYALTYDSLNRSVSITDPDNVSNYTCYYANGQTEYTETAAQHAADGNPSGCQGSAPAYAVSYAYDADGNAIRETHHNTCVPGQPCTAGTTQKWYDGLDRLVEVAYPHDPSDFFSYQWLTRYIYDLSGDQTVSMTGSPSFYAYGNLYKVQGYFGEIIYSGTTASPTWQDVRGTQYDALDRVRAQYKYAPGNTGGPYADTATYDASPATYGLLASSCNALNACANFAYDTLGRKSDITYQGDGGVTPEERYTYDPDGRVAATWSGTFGTESYTYNADGAVLTRVEPAGGGVTSPATISYAYYGDDTRAALSVSSSSLTQSDLYQYAYRQDGRRSLLLFNDPVGKQQGEYKFAYAYTNAGRETSRTDIQPSGAGFGTTSQTYDAYGQRTALNLPSGSYSGTTYDIEGNYTGDSYDVLAYSIRGELTQKTAVSYFICSGGCMQRQLNQSSANGMMVQRRLGDLTDTTKTFDERVSVPLDQVKAQATPKPTTGTGCIPGKLDPGCIPSTSKSYEYVWTYDSGGRETNKKTTTTTTTATFYGVTTKTYTTNVSLAYDAENRTVTDNGISYQWGPNGHPYEVGDPGNATAANTGTWHWDGDELLFVTDGSGALSDLKIEDIGDVQPQNTSYAGVTMYDRDPGGSIAATHWGNGATTPIDIQDPFQVNFKCGSPSLPLEPRTDGVMGSCSTTIQGVRSYDSDSQSWTTPDAYQGDVKDPMSLKSYMWNDNNPLAYSDPSGYAPRLECECGRDDLLFNDLAIREGNQDQGGTFDGPLVLRGGTLMFGPVGVAGDTAADVAAGRAILSKGITGFAKSAKGLFHGLHQLISRDGRGVAVSAVLDTIRNPIKAEMRNGALTVIGKKAVLVINKAGKVVTGFAKGHGNTRL